MKPLRHFAVRLAIGFPCIAVCAEYSSALAGLHRLGVGQSSFAALDVDAEPAALNVSDQDAVHFASDEVQAARGGKKPLRGAKWGSGKGFGKYKIRSDPRRFDEDDCGVVYKTDSSSRKDAQCPAECPYYSQNVADNRHCTFVCIRADQCKGYNPATPIADDELGICRSPMVQFCEDYVIDGSKVDHCKTCMSGYYLGSDGQCYYKFMYILITVAVIAAIGALILGLWVLDMWCRPVTNEKELKDALDFCSRNLLQQRGGKGLWPLTTNVCTQDVAGSGMLLHFNFQVAIMVWAVLVAFGWWLTATLVDEDLFRLGTRSFGTPRDNCILVAWGWETQSRLMWAKVAFLWVVYIGSFLLCLLFSIMQLRRHQALDFESKTMQDYVVQAVGVPEVTGVRNIEADLKQHLAQSTGAKIVGVTMAWRYKENEDDVISALRQELKEREEADDPQPPPEVADEEPEPQRSALRQKMYEYELTVLGPDEWEEGADEDVENLLKEMKTSDRAFIIFETEAERDNFYNKMKDSNGLDFEGSKLTFRMPHYEPDTVQWVNFGYSSPAEKSARMLQGSMYIFLGLLFWTVVFYAPYAWSVAHFNYDNGQEPGFIYGLSFSMVVVVGNVIMYEICNRVSELIGFEYKDDKEAAYLIFYTVACCFNIVVDFVTTYCTAYTIMSELGFRNYYGVPLDEIPMFPEGFETYAMQRSLAENTVAYAFPSTFLIPFLIEPFPTIFLPLIAGKLIVRTHKEIKGRDAEEWVLGAPMEMGRYGDLLLNIILGILIFYFPGGYTIYLFMAMAGSHLFIYLLDHWRVLRIIPGCCFASDCIDWWAQAMLAPCCGIILSCLVFKSGNKPGFPGLGVWGNFFCCSLAFVAHCAVHILLLKYFVPLFGLKKEEEGEDATTYEELNKDVGCTWFSSNPVHCLRSKYIHKDSPACDYYVHGKGHLIRKNPKIGCYFEIEKAEVKGQGAFEAVGEVAQAGAETMKHAAEDLGGGIVRLGSSVSSLGGSMGKTLTGAFMMQSADADSPAKKDDDKEKPADTKKADQEKADSAKQSASETEAFEDAVEDAAAAEPAPAAAPAAPEAAPKAAPKKEGKKDKGKKK
eukprot:TRINITY_DN299_c0_g2_i1.p1 TRINITY_DN299_c0_g2~~TRINITY_DN299_c0_g2_i1.p1  ORF type:complete len:1115 (-),score=281.77 TRINITY_DN299_c0_g2_i1:441-3722(-)